MSEDIIFFEVIGRRVGAIAAGVTCTRIVSHTTALCITSRLRTDGGARHCQLNGGLCQGKCTGW